VGVAVAGATDGGPGGVWRSNSVNAPELDEGGCRAARSSSGACAKRGSGKSRGVSESSVASAISQSGSRSYPTLADSFQAQTEQPKPQALGGPDESRIAATLGAQSDTGAQARGQAWQEKLQSMTPQEREQAFGGR